MNSSENDGKNSFLRSINHSVDAERNNSSNDTIVKEEGELVFNTITKVNDSNRNKDNSTTCEAVEKELLVESLKRKLSTSEETVSRLRNDTQQLQHTIRRKDAEIKELKARIIDTDVNENEVKSVTRKNVFSWEE